MITKTINQSWAIPDNFKERYGRIWSELDFEINPKLSNYAFGNDPMNTVIGTLVIDRKRISVQSRKKIMKKLSFIDKIVFFVNFQDFLQSTHFSFGSFLIRLISNSAPNISQYPTHPTPRVGVGGGARKQ